MTTEAEAIAALAKTSTRVPFLSTVKGPEDKDVSFAFLPDGQGGWKTENLKPLTDQARTRPERRKGTATITQLDSLIAHAKRFKDDDSALFAVEDPQAPRLIAVLDYHRKGGIADSEARHGTHRASYAFPLSDEWKAWAKVDQEALGQWDFAEFLEDRITDVMAPPEFLTGSDRPDPEQAPADARLFDMVKALNAKACGPAKLMELSKGLQIAESNQAKAIVNLSSGEAKLGFESEHKDAAGQKLDVPNLFLIAIPVFQGGPSYRVPVRLRYRLKAGQLSWILMLHRPDLCWTHAFQESCAKAAKDTDLPLFYGTPESS